MDCFNLIEKRKRPQSNNCPIKMLKRFVMQKLSISTVNNVDVTSVKEENQHQRQLQLLLLVPKTVSALSLKF